MAFPSSITQTALAHTKDVAWAKALAEELGVEARGVKAQVTFDTPWVRKRLRAGVGAGVFALAQCEDQEFLVEVATKAKAPFDFVEAVVYSEHLTSTTRRVLRDALASTYPRHSEALSRRIDGEPLGVEDGLASLLSLKVLTGHEPSPVLARIEDVGAVLRELVALGKTGDARVLSCVVVGLLSARVGGDLLENVLCAAWGEAQWYTLYQQLSEDEQARVLREVFSRLRMNKLPHALDEVATGEMLRYVTPRVWSHKRSGESNFTPEARVLLEEAGEVDEDWIFVLLLEQMDDEKFTRLQRSHGYMAWAMGPCVRSKEQAEQVVVEMEKRYEDCDYVLERDTCDALVAWCGKEDDLVARIYYIASTEARLDYLLGSWGARDGRVAPRVDVFIEGLQRDEDCPFSLEQMLQVSSFDIVKSAIVEVPGYGVGVLALRSTVAQKLHEVVWEMLEETGASEQMGLEMLLSNPEQSLRAVCEALSCLAHASTMEILS